MKTHSRKIHCLSQVFAVTNMIKIPITKANKISQFCFGKDLFVFRTDLLSIIRSLNTVFTTTGICHTSYVGCLLARLGWTSLVDGQHTMTNTYYCEYSIKAPDDGQ